MGTGGLEGGRGWAKGGRREGCTQGCWREGADMEGGVGTGGRRGCSGHRG